MNHNREFSSKWAPLLHNIGSTYRKLKNYEKSIEYHERALAGNSGKVGMLNVYLFVLNRNFHPRKAPSCDGYCLLGFSLALAKKYEEASDAFQSALSFDRNNQFALEMLKNVMEEITKVGAFPFSDEESDDDLKPVVARKGPLHSFHIAGSTPAKGGAGDMMSSTPNFPSAMPVPAQSEVREPSNLRQLRANAVRAQARQRQGILLFGWEMN